MSGDDETTSQYLKTIVEQLQRVVRAFDDSRPVFRIVGILPQAAGTNEKVGYRQQLPQVTPGERNT